MKVRTLIVDDEKLALQLLATMLEDIPEVQLVGQCQSVSEASDIIAKGDVDLLFLDVEMPLMTGTEFIKQIDCDPKPAIVLATAHHEFALEAFDLGVADYILKPFTRQRIEIAVERARRIRMADLFELDQLADPVASADRSIEAGAADPSLLRIKDGGRTHFLQVKHIVKVESDGDYALIHTRTREYAARMALKDLENRLPAPDFARVHRSTLIAVAEIREVCPLTKGEARVTLSDGSSVKVSRTYSGRLRDLLNRL